MTCPQTHWPPDRAGAPEKRRHRARNRSAAEPRNSDDSSPALPHPRVTPHRHRATVRCYAGLHEREPERAHAHARTHLHQARASAPGSRRTNRAREHDTRARGLARDGAAANVLRCQPGSGPSWRRWRCRWHARTRHLCSPMTTIARRHVGLATRPMPPSATRPMRRPVICPMHPAIKNSARE